MSFSPRRSSFCRSLGAILLLCWAGGASSPRARCQPAAAHGAAVRLRAVGDIMLAGPMAQVMGRQGRGYPFAAMRATLRGADITFGNLECSVSTRGAPIPKKFNFRADPQDLPVLKENGFKIVSVANNHAWDFGRE